jgi:hypothetical protein
MSLTYNIPKNSPASSVRLYRFPYQGERSSDRMNLLLQAIDGDLKHIHSVLEEAEGTAMEHLGGMSLLSIPPIAFQGFNVAYMLAPHITPYLAFNAVTVTAGKFVTIPVSLTTVALAFNTATHNDVANATTTSITIASGITAALTVGTIDITTTATESAAATIAVDLTSLNVAVDVVTIATETPTVIPVVISVSVIGMSATVNSVDVTTGALSHGGIGLFGRRIIT